MIHNSKIKVSAPGKLMLFGEHAVVYGRPCIVTAVDQRLFLEAEKIIEPTFVLDAPDLKVKNYTKPMTKLAKGKILPHAAFVEFAAYNFFKTYPAIGGVRIKTKAKFSQKFGFGSSASSVVCTIFALSKLFRKNLSKVQIFDLSYKTVLDIQGKGSGFDVAAAIYGGTLYFETGGKVIKPISSYSSSESSSARRVEKSKSSSRLHSNNNFPLIIGYSGMKADTVKILAKVAEFAKKQPKVVENIYNLVEIIVKNAENAIKNNDLPTLGVLMDINQQLLETLGVSSDKLRTMIKAARENGAYGAKLSGAGIGDCMIALGTSSKIKSAIQKAGGQIINVKTNAHGVRVEP